MAEQPPNAQNIQKPIVPVLMLEFHLYIVFLVAIVNNQKHASVQPHGQSGDGDISPGTHTKVCMHKA